MIYGSVCSGIEAATVAWEPLGWKPAWFSEIHPFCNKVLQTRYPSILNLGDMTQIANHPHFSTHIDLLVGGTPCQSFSLAGERGGLDDARGNLALEFIKILKRKQPRWFVWENVDGILSLNKGQDFNILRSKIREARYGYACGILDARDFGLLQNRPRVFVVGYLGDSGQRPYEVLRARPTRDYNIAGSPDAKRRIPTLTLRNAGNKNARGVAIIDSPVQRKWKTGPYGAESQWQIRACTPGEEERRQGFSGIHTAINGATDQERYESIGNSMAVPVMRWIGEQIQKNEEKYARD